VAARSRLLKHQGNKPRYNPSYHAMALTRQEQRSDNRSTSTRGYQRPRSICQARCNGDKFTADLRPVRGMSHFSAQNVSQ
jgi:hypothetical protein